VNNLTLEKKIKNQFKGKKIIITGGTGLIGRQLTKQLCDLNSKVTVVSLDKLSIEKRARHITGDLSDFNFCKLVTKNYDYAFHLAGIKASVKTTIEKPASFYVPLVMMNTNFLEACRINKVKKLVYTSSIGAYSKASIFKEKNSDYKNEPMDFYPGWAKRMAELQVIAYKKQFKLNNFFIVRPANVYGPGDNFDKKNAMVIPSLMSKILSKKRPVEVWGDGSPVRDFAYSGDIAEGILKTLVYGTGKYDFLNLGSGKGISIKKLVETMNKVVPYRYFFKSKTHQGFSKRIMDISAARKIIRYKPKTSLEAGLKITWEWFVKNHNQYKLRKNYFI
jgi:GDP-L-fucose synthase